MQPQVREAVGWLVYECERHITISWDRDAEAPTLRGGDPKSSGLVILKSCILELKRLHVYAEAVDYLKLYLQMRRKGTNKIPPENIHDESPLIRNMRTPRPIPISTTAVYTIIHKLYQQAGLISQGESLGKRHDICVHSIRKYFKTQLMALNVQPDYIEYMMGHTISTYHDIEMKGVEFLRGIYAASGLSIKPKTRINKIDALKEIIRAWGLNPDEILTREAMTQPNATAIEQGQVQNSQIRQLSIALKQQMLKEIREEQHETEQ
jgi:hypothetical protein